MSGLDRRTGNQAGPPPASGYQLEVKRGDITQIQYFSNEKEARSRMRQLVIAASGRSVDAMSSGLRLADGIAAGTFMPLLNGSQVRIRARQLRRGLA